MYYTVSSLHFNLNFKGKTMKLYYSKGACSLAIRILIHELGIKSEFESVNLGTKQTETGKDFLSITSKGSVPALLIDDSVTVLTEGVVIQQYLADTHNGQAFLPPVGDFNRYRVLEWMNFVATDLHKNCSPLFNSKIPADLKESIFKPNLKRSVDFLEKHLATNKYLNGDSVCIADFYCFVVLRWLSHFNMPLSKFPSIEQYFDRLNERKAFQAALKEEGLIESPMAGACVVK